MSALRLNSPTRSIAPRPTSAIASIRSIVTAPNKSRGFAVVRIVVLAILATMFARLFLTITISESAYELKNLKVEKAELTTQSQIIAQQVDSLSSQQNLANSAAALGMIANANPVFLRIADQQVFGKPKAALNTADRVARNNIASAALVVTSALSTTDANANVAQAASLGQLVAFSTETIPVSPTH